MRLPSEAGPLHDPGFRVDEGLGLQVRSIAELDIVCERTHEVEHA